MQQMADAPGLYARLQTHLESWLRFLRQRDKWQLRPIQARISLERKEIYDEAIPPQSFCGIQGQSGSGCDQGRRDPGAVGYAVRCSSESDCSMEEPVARTSGGCVQRLGTCSRGWTGYQNSACEDRTT